MSRRIAAALALAAAACFANPAARAHEGHRHPAKPEKVKKIKPQKKSGADIRFVVWTAPA